MRAIVDELTKVRKKKNRFSNVLVLLKKLSVSGVYDNLINKIHLLA